MSNVPSITIGKKNFNVISLLGEGTYGSVYEVEENGKRYALKVLDNKFSEGIKSLREIDIMGRLRHPNLTFAENFFTDISILKGNKYSTVGILMEKAETDLHTAMTMNNLSYQDRIKSLYDISKGLDFMHKNNYLHLDIKPLNILLFNEKNGLVSKLTDYGLSLLEIEKNGRKYKNYPIELVTVDHRSPYIIEGGRDYTDKDDIWSLGIVYLEVLSGGRTLFAGFKQNDYTDANVLNVYRTKLSEKNIDMTLENMLMKTIPANLRKSAIEVIKRILNFNASLRPKISEILASPLFSDINKNNFSLEMALSPDIPPYDCNVYYYEGIDTLIRVSANLPIQLETFFLSADLFVRLFSFFPIPSTERYKHILYLVCLSSYMAMKVVESYFPDPNRLSLITGGIISADKLIEGESKVVPVLNGIIYPKNLFNVSTTKRRIEEAFKICNDCFLYSRIDLNEWYKLSLSEEQQEGKFDKYISFSTFISSNEYYSMMIKDTEKRDYVYGKYEKDKQKYKN